MIRLAELIATFFPDLEQKYGHRLLPSHRQALAAIQQCRTQALGSAAGGTGFSVAANVETFRTGRMPRPAGVIADNW